MKSNKYNWSKIMEEQKVSNLTITEFCKQKKLNKSSFYRWIHKLSSPDYKEHRGNELTKEEVAKIEYWHSLIEEQKASDLGAVTFCRQKQVSQTSFYRWKNKLDTSTKNENATKEEKAGWVEAVPVNSPVSPSEKAEISVKVGDFTVRVPNDFEEFTFLRVCKALVSLC
jgi:hypothetical protein